jgi:hypothetical protein
LKPWFIWCHNNVLFTGCEFVLKPWFIWCHNNVLFTGCEFVLKPWFIWCHHNFLFTGCEFVFEAMFYMVPWPTFFFHSQVVSLCWSHGLYDAIIYVYNQGMMDYTTPLEDLLIVLRSAVDTGKQLTGITKI